ncbi:hypothetical protein G5B47_02485 [Paenibacillus sp. 7124]|uniref:Pectate lyase superfamily protein domain-containing protein n=1 Tax=Paenibacillus apii TaxID=1850370 RepID=A0A6M1PDK1_9BACL|nr:hypothetical protein [Paenibacillus apii]NGM81276.1 hypothetical protein [Paenibacillus apii]
MTNKKVELQLLNEQGQVVEIVSPQTEAVAVKMANGNNVEDEITQLKYNGSGSTTGNLIDIKQYNISASGVITTGNTQAGSNILTVTSTDSFIVGQDIAIENAANVKALNFIKVATKPVSSGIITLTCGTLTAQYNIVTKQQIFDLTFHGTSERTGQFGISLEWNTKYINLYQGETAEVFANRIATDPYFTNLWEGWTISSPAAGVVRFTSVECGSRKYGAQVFGFGDLWGEFAEIQEGTGSIGSVKGTLEWGPNIPGWIKWSNADNTLAYECSIAGPQPEITYDAGTTGVTLVITNMMDGIDELVTKIVDVNSLTNKITMQDVANYTVSNTSVRHDDTRGIQAAIDYCFDHGGGRIALPEGIYRFTRLWMKDHVTIAGTDRSSTILRNHERVWPSIKAIGEGSSNTDPRNEYIDTWGLHSLTIDSAYTGDVSTLPFTRIALEMFLCHTVTVVDVDVRNHFIGVSERCSWYTHFENVKVEGCYNGWQVPYFQVSATPSNHINCTIKDNKGMGMYLNSPDVFNWVGGAIERNAGGGVLIQGGQTRTVTFDTVNLESNGGIPVEIGDDDGNAPTGICFRNCSFKHWDGVKQDVAIKLHRIVGFELTSPKFFNYNVAIDLSTGNSSFVVTNPSFDGCNNYYKFEGGILNSTYYLCLKGDWDGIIGQTSTGWSQLLPTTKTISLAQVADHMAQLTTSTLLTNYSLVTAIPGLSIPANSTIDIDLSFTGAAINDDVRVIIDNMASGLVWNAWIAEVNKVKLRIANITTTSIAIAETHNIRMTVTKFS